MAIAALYDIHANLTALKAVVEELKKYPVTQIVIGGDVIAGPQPIETLELLQEVTTPTYFVRGNAESDLLRYLNGEQAGGLSANADEITSWVAKQLTSSHQQFIASWQPYVELTDSIWGQMVFCHASLRSDTEIFTRLSSKEKLCTIFQDVHASTIVCGHTHMQFNKTIADKRIINAGSVGMPFAKPGAQWLLLNEQANLMHTNYDVNQAAEQIKQTSYPQRDAFIKENILTMPTEEQALKILSDLEQKQTAFQTV
ncbi:metallophosphoesterase family protein [Celerinatantimonas sp. MCCC 1A17872]|uniref:metallophosphoesterase family protein n=1 Tax=Celerinatantimonas sp. MCCC 1A17872 TaxID=3177514 RepID=UPI0038C70943